MKILFIGTVEFSKIALKKLIELNAQVVGVCTKEKSEFNSDFLLCPKVGLFFLFIMQQDNQACLFDRTSKE